MTRPTVDLWYTRCGSATASALAIEQGWLQAEFDRPGTRLRALRESTSLSVRNAHYNHSQSGMFREGGNIPPIWARGAGQDTVVTAITWLDEYQGVLVRDDGPIRSIADLAGRRLGLPLHRQALVDFQRGAAQHGLANALGLAGLGLGDVILVDLEAPDFDTQDGPRPTTRAPHEVELDALRAGRVDAVFLRFARGVRAARSPGVRELINLGHHPERLRRVNNGTPRPVTVDRAFLDRHPDLVARYLAVLLRTARWAAEHHDEVVQLLRRDSGGASVAKVVASHGPRLHESFTPGLGANFVAGLEAQKNFLRDWGYLKADFDIADWIVTEPLAEARRLVEERPALIERPSAVTA